jgi:hypothetical protein
MDDFGALNEGMSDHASLYHRVSEYANRPGGSPKADIQVDQECGLGRWLSTDGARYQALPEHAMLKEMHTAFHRTSADTVRRADAGTLPDGWLGEKGQLKASLAHLCTAIAKMTFKIG